MTGSRTALQAPRRGMEIYSSDGGHLGRVKVVGLQQILVDRTMHRDIFVPRTFISRVVEDQRRVELSLTEEMVSGMHWEHPPLADYRR